MGARHDEDRVFGGATQLLDGFPHVPVDVLDGAQLVEVSLGLAGGFHCGGERGIVAEDEEAAFGCGVAFVERCRG